MVPPTQSRRRDEPISAESRHNLHGDLPLASAPRQNAIISSSDTRRLRTHVRFSQSPDSATSPEAQAGERFQRGACPHKLPVPIRCHPCSMKLSSPPFAPRLCVSFFRNPYAYDTKARHAVSMCAQLCPQTPYFQAYCRGRPLRIPQNPLWQIPLASVLQPVIAD